VFIASDPAWAARFEEARIPIIGDDIKAQLGATIVHRVLTDLFAKRGVKLDRTYQLNTGGNTDFLNMSNRSRLKSKKISKTEAVQSVAEHRLDPRISTSAPPITSPGRTTTKSASSAWRAAVRRRADEPGATPVGRGQPEQRRRGDRHDPLRQARPGRGIGGPIHPASAYFCKHPLGR
jgi:myo-inositol-1-phosphate synthase